MRACTRCFVPKPESEFTVKNRRCKACRNEIQKAYRAGHRARSAPETRYPLDSLLQAMGVGLGAGVDNGFGWHSDVAVTLRVQRKTFDKWIQRKTLSWKQADEAAVHAGLHPRDVWSDWW